MGARGLTCAVRQEKPALPATGSCLLSVPPWLWGDIAPRSARSSTGVPVVLSRHRIPRSGVMWLSSGKPELQNRKVNCYLLSKLLSHFLTPLSFIFPVCFLKNNTKKSVFQGANQSQVQDQGE